MTIAITGSMGCQCNLTIADTATSTGSKTVTYKTEDSIRTVTFTNASKVCSLAGQVGTVGTTIDLYSIADANDGTYYMRLQDTSAPIVLGTLLSIIFHNKHTSGTITVVPGASNSFLTASEQITIAAGAAAQLTYPSTGAKTVSNTVRNLKLVGSTTNMDCEVYILGTT